jgi:hypothetical protein
MSKEAEAAAEKAPITKKSTRNLPYRFTDEELLGIGKELAERTEQLTALESDKKRVVSDFAAKIAGKESDISVLTNKIRSGYEYRELPVTEVMHTPKPGLKQIIRDDDGKVAGEERMTNSELQEELQLAEKSEPVNGQLGAGPGV